MGKMDIYNSLAATPKEARKTIKGGRLNGFTDINPMWRIKRLTELFGPCGIGWYIEVEKVWLEESYGEEVKAFAIVHLFIRDRDKDEWSMPITGLGGSSYVSKERNGAYVSDECFKMAVTDAIGSACKLLGMSADIFFEKDRTKYTQESEVPAEAEDTSARAELLGELIHITTPNEQKALKEKYGPLAQIDEDGLRTLIEKIKRKKETT